MNATHSEAAIDAIVEEVGSRIPTLEQFAAIADPRDMGPDVTIPAIWMSLLLSRIRGLKATLRLRDLEPAGSLPRWSEPVTTDDMGDYAGALADHAVRTFGGDQTDAAAVLFQGGVSILMTTLPSEAVIDVMNNLVDFFGLHETLGIGEALQ